jgi:ABC-type nitrate/sulfonate/bicarbonate transport system permease component
VHQLAKILVPLIAMVVFLAFWEWLVWYMGWPKFKMAAPSDLWPAYMRYWELFLDHTAGRRCGARRWGCCWRWSSAR